jgi:hypothetical protein
MQTRLGLAARGGSDTIMHFPLQRHRMVALITGLYTDLQCRCCGPGLPCYTASISG